MLKATSEQEVTVVYRKMKALCSCRGAMSPYGVLRTINCLQQHRDPDGGNGHAGDGNGYAGPGKLTE
jgi:hypothetical protein